VRAGEHLDRLGLAAVTAHRAQRVPFQAHHVGQGVRVSSVALATRAAFGFPEPGHLQRVDRVHRVAGRDQRLHPRTPVGLDPDHHLHLAGVPIDVFADHRV
jgi:hypothetical protein